MKCRSLFIFLVLVAVVFARAPVVRADQVMAQDTTGGYGLGTEPTPCYPPSDHVWGCPFSPEFVNYHAPTAFIASKITVDWANNGSNNCDGLGHVIAVITSLTTPDSVLATSTNSIYMGCASVGGVHGTGEFDLPPGVVIPPSFYLSFTSPDGVQGGSSIGIGNITVYGSPNAVTEPVVIVPGIMGSALRRAADGEEVWPNALKMLLPGSDSYLDDLKLLPNGAQTTPIVAGDIIRRELIFFSFYDDLIKSLEADGYEENASLFVAPYDWRMSVASSADAVATVVARAAAASPDGKVNVIAHSMGGLVIKEYLKNAAGSTPVDKLILAGVPELGAPSSFKILNYGDDLGLSFFGIGLNQDETRAIAQNMPGVYDLVPTRRYIDVNGGYIKDFMNGGSLTLTYAETGALVSNPAMLSAADGLHGPLDDTAFNLPAQNIYNIMGCGRDTLGEIREYDGDRYEIGFVNGDGTVPLTSAADLSASYHNFFLAGIDHTGLVKDPSSLALMAGILSGTGVSGSSSDCDASALLSEELLISMNGPAVLDIYDDAGDHTGPTDASGTVELGIPGSSYESIGNGKFISVPAGKDYRVVTTANASGTADLSTQTLEDLTPKKKTTYVAVKLPKPAAKASLTITPSDTSPPLVVSTDDNSVPAVSQDPTAILDVNTSGDATPPTLFMPSLPDNAVVGSAATFVFSAADDESGVATIQGTLNGLTILSGQKVTLDRVGANTFRLWAEDNAGNPSVREAVFTVAAAGAGQPAQSCVQS